jgi:hypothetical protein
MANAAEIANQLGLTSTGEGGYTGSCPSCGYETGFSVVDKDGKTLLYCHAGGCSQQDIIEALREYGLWGGQPSGFVERPMQRRAPTSKADTTRAALEMWQRSEPAADTVVETYLRARGYRGEIPMALRYVRGKHPADEGFHPARIAAAVLLGDPLTLVGVHRTFLQGDGSGKTLLSPQKMSLGNLRGAGVPLSVLGSKVVVSEGIEYRDPDDSCAVSRRYAGTYSAGAGAGGVHCSRPRQCRTERRPRRSAALACRGSHCANREASAGARL